MPTECSHTHLHFPPCSPHSTSLGTRFLTAGWCAMLVCAPMCASAWAGQVGSGRIKVEVPSRSVSSLRPFVYFRYELTAQMYFEQVEWLRVTVEEQAKQHGADSDDEHNHQHGNA